MRLLRVLGIALLALVAVILAVAIAARFADGPLGPFAGGPLESGTWVEEPVADWSFAADVREVELQLLQPPRSRTTWLLVHEGDLYIPCGFLKVPGFKRWPHEAVRDGRAVLRSNGRLYRGRLVKVEDPALQAQLGHLGSQKYGFADAPPDPEAVWFFRFEPLPQA